MPCRRCAGFAARVLAAFVVALSVSGAGVGVGEARAEQRTTTLSNLPITIHYDSSDERVADRVSEICAGAIPSLAAELGLVDVTAFHIYLIQDMPAFERQQGINLPSWGVAFALMNNQVMLVDVDRASNAWNTLEKVIPHELSHLLLAQRIGPDIAPVWFVEGLAMWQAREWGLMDHWRLMESVWTRRTPTLTRMSRGLPAVESQARDAYRIAYAGFTERFGEAVAELPLFLDEIERRGEFEAAFASYFGESQADYSARFAHELSQRYQSRLLLFQAGPLFSILAILFLFVILRSRWRNRRKLREMERVEGRLPPDNRRVR